MRFDTKELLFIFTLMLSICLTGNCCFGDECGNRFNYDQTNYQHVNPPQFVDFNNDNNNLIVRGSLPLIIFNDQRICMDSKNWTFAYSEMEAWIKKISADWNAGKSNPCPEYLGTKCDELKVRLTNFNMRDYNLIDVSLINNGDADVNFLHAEIRSFADEDNNPIEWTEVYKEDGCGAKLADYPDACYPPYINRIPHGVKFSKVTGASGQFVWWPMGFWDCNQDSPYFLCAKNHDSKLACTPSPENCDPFNLLGGKTELLGGTGYNFIDQVDFLGAIFRDTDPSQKPRLIYIHCTWGTDRTGALHMGYLLNNYVTTFKDALKYGTSLRLGPPNVGSKRLVNAYCQYLQAVYPDRFTCSASSSFEYDPDGD